MENKVLYNQNILAINLLQLQLDLQPHINAHSELQSTVSIHTLYLSIQLIHCFSTTVPKTRKFTYMYQLALPIDQLRKTMIFANLHTA